MDLILWRHAQAHGQSGDPDDLQRRLTAKGEKQAQRMARWLNLHLPQTARILSSPAVRTESTVAALGRAYKVAAALAPEANADSVLALVQWPQAKGVTLVVGHQPTLGQVAARLLGVGAGELSIKKGALWWLRQREGGQAQLLCVQSPDLLQR
jgi:phosphohistidine phosphatase